MRTPLITLSACLAIASLVAGCDKEKHLVRSDTPRAVPTADAKSNIPQLTGDLDKFALNAYEEIRGGTGDNIIYSPLSVSLALAMAAVGAEGDTQTQMYHAMSVDLPADAINPAFNALDLEIVGNDGEDQFKLHIANGLWTQQGFTIQPGFLDQLARYYGSGLSLVNFKDDANREQARSDINGWVSDETNGKIKDLIPKGMLTPYTRLVLANAVYFLGKWVEPFDPDSSDQDFTRQDGSTVQVPMMKRKTDTRYAEGNGCQAVALDYRGDRIEMVVLLPSPDTFESFDKDIDAKKVGAIIDGMKSVQVELNLPRFTYAATLDFVPILKSMGMVNAFEFDHADFSGITTEEELAITGIVHKAFVAVDEEGTEAAAATGISFGVTSAAPQDHKVMRVDRPFLFAIRDRHTGAILFMGRVMDPS